jgi:hypothetical protein
LLAEAFGASTRAVQVIGLDVSPWMVNEATQNVAESCPRLAGSIKFVQGCMMQLVPLENEYPDDETYDAIHVGFAVPDISCLSRVVERLKVLVRIFMMSAQSKTNVNIFFLFFLFPPPPPLPKAQRVDDCAFLRLQCRRPQKNAIDTEIFAVRGGRMESYFGC